MLKQYAALDKRKKLTGINKVIKDTFEKCVMVNPPAVANAQQGLGKNVFRSM